ncbi:RNA polymerase-binding protein DksA [Streptomyces griseochromogenes]|uniref:DNA-binding protein n=1 Tax=Streptomyces griseochromogenes TaxID=68214 RepID=A0A1B1B6Q1_9ACTN|nr:TraR/DksA family transcriptional regulator [Streptomyces griseochromogenes]ANP54504.1 DNA-binding protein [Streptomyces griseochromogenes]MBP2048971.1 RNA polymerase-binding protein DksA [Streptomyces griseochromogenes]
MVAKKTVVQQPATGRTRGAAVSGGTAASGGEAGKAGGKKNAHAAVKKVTAVDKVVVDEEGGRKPGTAAEAGKKDSGNKHTAEKAPVEKASAEQAPVTKAAVAKKATAKKAAAAKTTASRTAGQKAGAKGTAAAAATKASTKKASTKKAGAGKTAVKAAAAKKTTAEGTAVKATEGGKKTGARSTAAGDVSTGAAEKSTAKKAGAARAAKQTGATTVVAKKTPGTATAEQTAVPKARIAAAEPGELAVRPGEDPWTPEEVAEARAELTAEALRLKTEISSSEESLVGLMRDSGDGAGDDQADTGTKNITREHEMALAANAREMLIQTERALERLDAGTYGLCENCGNPIGKARMQAFPRATLCVECKQKQERRS